MFKIVESHLEKWIKNKKCTKEEYGSCTQELMEYIPNNIKEAATLQAQHLYPALKKIKHEMGADWEKLYVVIPCVWPVAGINPRSQALSRLMTPDQMHTRVFLLDNLSTMDQWRRTLGRVIGDRASANLILGAMDHEREKMMYAFCTRQDLMANASFEAMNDIIKHEHHDCHQNGCKEAREFLEKIIH